MTSEKTIQSEILLDIGALPWLRVWRNNTGQAWTGNKVERAGGPMTVRMFPGDVLIRKAHPISFGLAGSADILGIERNQGKFVAIEVKTPKGRQSEKQKKFQNMIESMNGIYILARNTEDVWRGFGIL